MVELAVSQNFKIELRSQISTIYPWCRVSLIGQLREITLIILIEHWRLKELNISIKHFLFVFSGIQPNCEKIRATGVEEDYTYLIDPDGPSEFSIQLKWNATRRSVVKANDQQQCCFFVLIFCELVQQSIWDKKKIYTQKKTRFLDEYSWKWLRYLMIYLNF